MNEGKVLTEVTDEGRAFQTVGATECAYRCVPMKEVMQVLRCVGVNGLK